MSDINQSLHSAKDKKDEEIDLVPLLIRTWVGRKTIIKTAIPFLLIGIFVALTSPKQYSITTIMVPNLNNGSNKLGGLSSLAAMAGFNLETGGAQSLNPLIYPEILQSASFQKKLMYAKLNFEGYEEKITLIDYYTDPKYSRINVLKSVKKYTIGLPGTIMKISGKLISVIRSEKESILDQPQQKEDNNITYLTFEEIALTSVINSNISLDVDQRLGYITFKATMPEALATAQLGVAAIKILQDKIIEFKIEKSTAQLEFILERYTEKKIEFENARRKLALFRDQNKNVTTALARTEEEELQYEYQLLFGVYSELAKRLENARIQVKEDTPVFSIIKPITVPVSSFTPKPKLIVLTWLFMGIALGVALIFGKGYYDTFKGIWKNQINKQDNIKPVE